MQHHFKLAESRHAACQMKAVTRSTAYHAGCCVLNHHEKTEVITWWQDDDFRSFYSLRDLTGLYVLKMVMMVQSFRMVSVSSEPASAQSQWQSCQYLKRLSKMTPSKSQGTPFSCLGLAMRGPKSMKHISSYLPPSLVALCCVMLRYVAFEFGCGWYACERLVICSYPARYILSAEANTYESRPEADGVSLSLSSRWYVCVIHSLIHLQSFIYIILYTCIIMHPSIHLHLHRHLLQLASFNHESQPSKHCSRIQHGESAIVSLPRGSPESLNHPETYKMCCIKCACQVMSEMSSTASQSVSPRLQPKVF